MRHILILALLASSGCCSIRTTAIDRKENDCIVVNPECPMHGIPVSLRIPTHLELKVIETTYWEKQDIPGEKPTLVPLSTCRATRTVEHSVCYTEKIFLVDPVRPAAGTSNFGFEFTSNGSKKDGGQGYLKKVSYKIDDQTIKESANLLSNALGFISAFQTGASDPKPNTGTLISTDRTVAYGQFDINGDSFEEEVSAFLDCNVNRVGNDCVSCPKICTPARCSY